MGTTSWTRMVRRSVCSEAFIILLFLAFVCVQMAGRGGGGRGDSASSQLQEHHALQGLTRESSSSLHSAHKQVLASGKGTMTDDDPRTIWLLRTRYLHPPDGLAYNLQEDGGAKEETYLQFRFTNPSWIFIDSVLHDLFFGQKPGFFVEAGALDGEFLSNTLKLEKGLGWTGLLVEAEQESYKILRAKHRRAWSSPACLATTPFPHTSILTSFRGNEPRAEWWNRGAARIEQDPVGAGDGPGYKTFQTVQCFPLLSFFLALNITTVNFFSLDVEGMEMGVLRNFPFERMTVDVWAIEHRPISTTASTSRSTEPSGELMREDPNHSILNAMQAVDSKSEKLTHDKSDHSNTQTTGDSNSEKLSYEDPDFVDFMERQGYYLFDMFCHHIPDYIFVRRGSEVFKRLGVPRELWRRRGICPHKRSWTEAQLFDPRHHRDSRHWPQLKYSKSRPSVF